MPFRTLVAVAVAFALTGVLLAVDPPRALPPGKDTTVVTGPFDKDGTINYETALNERMKGKSTADTNAVVLLLKAIGPKPEGSLLHADYYKWLGVKELPEKGDYVVRQIELFEDEIRGEDPQAFWDREADLRARPWTANEEPKLAEWLAVNAKPLKLVAEAARRPDYFYPFISRRQNGERDVLIGSLLSMVQRTRELASILSLRVMFHCGGKRYDAAWADVLTMHRLGRLVSKGGSLIELLVGIAIDATARGQALRFLEVAKPDAKQALSYRDDLLKLPPLATLADKIDLFERFMFLDGAQFIRRDGFRSMAGLLDRDLPDVPEEVVNATLARLDWDRVLKTGNGWHDKMVAGLRKPTRADRQTALAALEADLKKAKAAAAFDGIVRDSGDADKRAAASDRAGDLLTGLLLPTVAKVSEAADRQEVQFRTELLAFALAAHYADHKKYPAKLADLVPKYAATIPCDTYSGKELLYKPNATGYELYSVGMNGRDDGGHMLHDEPRGDDYGLRMPHAKKVWPTPDAPKWPFPPGEAGNGPKK